MSSEQSILKVEHVTRRFGGLVALHDVSFTVREGEVRGIIGPNGAGKTTLFNVITGELAATTGSIYLRDQKITGLSPHKICRMGLGRTFQMTLVFPEMTVFESLWVGINAKMPKPWHRFQNKNIPDYQNSAVPGFRFLNYTSLGWEPHAHILWPCPQFRQY